MKVIFVPYWKENAYHALLADSLSRQGVDIDSASTIQWKLVYELLKERYQKNIVHLHCVDRFTIRRSILRSLKAGAEFILKLIVLRLFGISIVLTVHDLLSHDKKFTGLQIVFNRMIARTVHALIGHSNHATKEIARTYWVSSSKVHMIPHGHYLSAYPRGMPRSEARKVLGLKEADYVFLYFGFIRPYKGVPELMKDFTRLNLPKAKLLIVGRPFHEGRLEEIQRLSKQCPEIRLKLGYIPDQEIQVYMSAADVVVLPFTKIFTSGSVILAMSFSKPIIASTKGSIPEILDSSGGYLFDPEEEDGLSRALKQAYTVGQHVLEKMGEHNFSAIKKFEWNDIAAQTYELYEQV